MEKFFRVDFRLLHGQVGMTWIPYLGADCLLIANDHIMDNTLLLTSIRMAKPSGVKLVIKTIEDRIAALNSGVTDKYHLMIVVDSIEDAYRLLKKTGFKQLNIGATRFAVGKKQVLDGVYLDEQDMSRVRELAQDGVHMEVQMIPSKPKTDIMTLI